MTDSSSDSLYSKMKVPPGMAAAVTFMVITQNRLYVLGRVQTWHNLLVAGACFLVCAVLVCTSAIDFTRSWRLIQRMDHSTSWKVLAHFTITLMAALAILFAIWFGAELIKEGACVVK